jgi:hypothetical protein
MQIEDCVREDVRTSIACWKMAGVVSEEKVMVLAAVFSGGKAPRNWLMMEVFAVPGLPTSREACNNICRCSKLCASSA